MDMSRTLVIVTLCVIRTGSNVWASQTHDDSKIVGGFYVRDIHTVRWIVSIRKFFEGEGFTHDCGGSILTPAIVLTACHCLQGEPEEFEFAAGAIDLEDDETSQVRTAEDIYHHPECEDLDDETTYDISLAVLKEDFIKTHLVKPMKILSWNPRKFDSKMTRMLQDRHSTCFVSGWGVDVDGGSEASRYLKAARMYPITAKKCRKIYARRKNKFKHFDFQKYHQICAVSKFNNESDCIGDSGGPFVCDGYTIAVVSYGFECGTPTPSVYATLPHFMKWFNEEIRTRYRRLSGEARRASEASSPRPNISYTLFIGFVVQWWLMSHETGWRHF